MLQALHGRDEGDPPALALRRVVAARRGDAVGRAAGARARGGLRAALRRERRTSRAGTRAGRAPRTRGEVVAELGLDPSRKTAVVFSHVLWDANMFYGARPLRRPGGVVRRDRARGVRRTTPSTGSIKLHPANVWKRKRDGVDRRARRAGRDSRARRLATAARARARADERRLHVVAVRRRPTGA